MYIRRFNVGCWLEHEAWGLVFDMARHSSLGIIDDDDDGLDGCLALPGWEFAVVTCCAYII